MNKFKILAALFLVLACGALGGNARAQEGSLFSGTASAEAGMYSPSTTGAYVLSRLLLKNEDDLDQDLLLSFAGEADAQAAGSDLPPSWPAYPQTNALRLQTDNLPGTDGTLYSLQMDRAFLKWTTGALEVKAGLQDFDWGSSYLYRPTDYFFPTPPLVWQRDEPLGSEALDASCFLFDFLSVEGAARWLDSGRAEGVLRFVNKGIGIGVSPSFAFLSNRNEAGLELSGTFPDFQARLEGVSWFYPDGTTLLEWVAGLSTVKNQTTFNLEFYKDASGQALGVFSTGYTPASYFFASVEKRFPAKWGAFAGLLKSVDGGPALFWVKAEVDFERDWDLGYQAWLPIGAEDGPLAGLTHRNGVSVSYIF
jgi:hypothetical protein